MNKYGANVFPLQHTCNNVKEVCVSIQWAYFYFHVL